LVTIAHNLITKTDFPNKPIPLAYPSPRLTPVMIATFLFKVMLAAWLEIKTEFCSHHWMVRLSAKALQLSNDEKPFFSIARFISIISIYPCQWNSMEPCEKTDRL
jgi:hypothetical protein